MKHVSFTAALAVMLLPSLGAAENLSAFAGRWAGAGTLTLEGEPAQPFRCRLRLRETGPAQVFFSGRCATAQASQSFTYMLEESPDGSLIARNTAPVEGNLPNLMMGQSRPNALRVTSEDGAFFTMDLQDAALVFRIEAEGDQGLARGEARLARRAE